MAKRILLIVVVLIAAGCLYVGYTAYDAKRSGEDGEVRSSDPSSGRGRKSVQDIAPTDARTASSTPIVDPPANSPIDPARSTAPDANLSSQPGTRSVGAAAPPASDTISPNPTNGMVFSGTGHYQLYRQGNLTWRLNTDTGQSCILFATDEEWKKSKVMHAGCGRK